MTILSVQGKEKETRNRTVAKKKTKDEGTQKFLPFLPSD
jgi:hypothetical protein